VRTNEVSRIWRAPEAEMPRELVAALRRAAPEIVFPASTPHSLPEEDARPLAAAAPGPGEKRNVPGEAPAVRHSAGSDRPASTSASVSRVPAPAGDLQGETAGSSPLDWLLATLQAVMEGVMAGDAAPLQKANAVARLAGHFLKAYRAKELEAENKVLCRRVQAAEARVAELEADLAASAARPLPLASAPHASTDVARRAGSLAAPDRKAAPGSVTLPQDLRTARAAGESLASRGPTGDLISLTAANAQTGHDPP
jgi:hypothetical protein